jgi:hypothetical protein
MAPTTPGEVTEMDLGKLGTLIDPLTGKQVVYGLLTTTTWPYLSALVGEFRLTTLGLGR